MTTSAPRRRILFVDDEQQILASLRMVLRRDNARWDMVFADTPELALAELKTQPFDLIVSDMRMPAMDGARLLEIVQERWPATVRFILSGHAERESVLRALPSLHQYLAKPVSPSVLRASIERGLMLAEGTANPRVREVIGRLDRLPTPPTIFRALTEIANDPHATIGDASALVESDPALVAKVLQLASSAAFGSGKAVKSVDRAVRELGLELVRMLALQTCVFAPVGARLPIDVVATQNRSLAAGLLARDLMADRGDGAGEAAFAAALLHEVGRLVLALGFPTDYGALGPLPTPEAERAAFGVDHAQVGSYLLGIWGLGLDIVEAVAQHHAPKSPLANAVHFAASVIDTTPLAPMDVDEATLLHWNTLADAFRVSP